MTIRSSDLWCWATAAWLLTGTAARAAPVEVPNAFTSGTTAQASQVNENFTAIQTAVNDNDGRIAALEAPGSVTPTRIANGAVTLAHWAQSGCTVNQIPKWSGTAWGCAADASNAGTVTSVATGAGLTGGPITGAGTIGIAPGGVTSAAIADATITFADWAQNGCTANQIPKWSGSAWGCAADASNPGTVTSVTAGVGLTGGSITGAGTIGIATGGVSSTMIADGAVNAQKLASGAITSANTRLAYLPMEERRTNHQFDVGGSSDNPICVTTSYTPTVNQVAFVDASISWYTASATSAGSVNALFRTYVAGAWSAWTSAFDQGLWTTSASGAWTNSARSGFIPLQVGVPYQFAVAGWSAWSTAFTATDSVCALRVVFAAR